MGRDLGTGEGLNIAEAVGVAVEGGNVELGVAVGVGLGGGVVGVGVAVAVGVGDGVPHWVSMYCWLSFVPVPGAAAPATA